MMQRNYSQIYSKLVSDEYDVVGHIAYSLYKQQKVQHITNYEKLHGVKPTDTDLIEFNNFSNLEHSIESYNLKAEMILQGFIDNILNETYNEIHHQVKLEQSSILKEIIEPIKPPSLLHQYFHSTLQNTISTILVGILIALLFLFFQFRNKGIKEVFESVTNTKIISVEKVKSDSIKKTKNY